MNLMINISEEDYEVFKKQHVVINSSSNARDRLFNAVKNGVKCDDCPSKQFVKMVVNTDPEIHSANREEQSCNNCLHIRKFMCSEYKTCHNKSEWKPKKVEICPECGAEYAVGEYDDGFLCANCGADMRSNPNRIHDCYNCEWEEDRDSGECYECVKGIQDHFTPKKTEDR